MAKSKSESDVAPKGKRGRQPKVVKPYGHVFDFRRPVGDPQAEIDLYLAVADGKTPSPNVGLMTGKAFGDAVRAQQAADENGDSAPSMPATYSMIRRELANRFRAVCIISGQKGKGKKPLKAHDVPDSIAKTFGDADRVFTNEAGEAMPLRLCHKPDVRKLVTDAESNILTVRDHEYVVGTTDESAVFLANGAKTGNYGANIMAGKLLSFDGMGGKIKNLVAQINNAAEIITLDDGTEPGCQYPVPPNTILRWGHFVRDDKEMTPAQVRKAVESDDIKGMKFVALAEPIVGNSFNQSKLWQAVKRQMSLADTKRGDGDDATTALERFEGRAARSGDEATDMTDRCWHNLRSVQTRTNPNETFPFGLFNMQTGIVPVSHYGSTVDEELVRFVIGAFVGADYSENRWEANYRLHPEQYEDAKSGGAAAPVTKTVAAPKTKTNAKTPKAKTTKPKAAAKPKTPKVKVETETAAAADAEPVADEPEVEVETATEDAEEVAV